MKRFLRYNTRHRIYWELGGTWSGQKVKLGWPQLNPISSRSSNTIKTISWHEPLWMFRLRQRWFAFAGRQRCGRRDDPFAFNHKDGEAPDTWDYGPDGNRTCSYCGSIHFDDLLAICKKIVAREPGYSLDGTDKSYKVYVRQPNVQNASEGAIKFYKQHVTRDPTEEEQKLYAEALRLSYERWRAQWTREGGYGKQPL